jgi:hypothetical protein
MASSFSTTRSGGKPHAHAAARGDKAHADGLCRFDAVVQSHAIGVNVEMVAAGGAAAEQQFGHGHLGADLHHLWRQPCPNRVQAAQPAKQLGVLHRGDGPGEALVHVVVRVDKPWRDQMPTRINHIVGALPLARRRPDRHNLVVADKDRGVAQFAALRVLGGNAVGVTD